jgi:hypothetical protein
MKNRANNTDANRWLNLAIMFGENNLGSAHFCFSMQKTTKPLFDRSLKVRQENLF